MKLWKEVRRGEMLVPGGPSRARKIWWWLLEHVVCRFFGHAPWSPSVCGRCHRMLWP